MDVYFPRLNFSLFHLYTGHRNVEEAGEGITALILALQTLTNLKSCDILMLQSAAHDHGRMASSGCFSPTYKGPDCIAEYKAHVKEVADILGSIFPSNSSTKIYWKGESFRAYRDRTMIFVPLSVKLHMEEYVADILKNTSVQFVNISKALAYLPTMRTNWIAHIGQYSQLDKSSLPLLWTFVSTEALLNRICKL